MNISNIVTCDNSRRNSYGICAVNTVPLLLQVTIENIIVLLFFVLLHVLTCDLLQILISVMPCYVTQCFEENKCYINLIFQCFKMPFVVYFSDRLPHAYNISSILIQYNFSAVYSGDWSNCAFLDSDSVFLCRWIPAFQGSSLSTSTGWEDCVAYSFFCLKTVKHVLILSNRNI